MDFLNVNKENINREIESYLKSRDAIQIGETIVFDSLGMYGIFYLCKENNKIEARVRKIDHEVSELRVAPICTSYVSEILTHWIRDFIKSHQSNVADKEQEDIMEKDAEIEFPKTAYEEEVFILVKNISKVLHGKEIKIILDAIQSIFVKILMDFSNKKERNKVAKDFLEKTINSITILNE